MNKVFCILLIAILAVPQTGLTKKKDKKAAALASSVKTDDYTKAPIEGVTFSLKKADGTVVGTATTDSKGEAKFDKLYL